MWFDYIAVDGESSFLWKLQNDCFFLLIIIIIIIVIIIIIIISRNIIWNVFVFLSFQKLSS